MTPKLSTTAVLLAPPDLGLAQLRINGFSTLKPAEQLQAAALALHRDLSVEPINLRIAVASAPQSDHLALVAFCTRPAADSSVQFATNLLPAMLPGKVFWVNAPSGYIIGEHGAAAVDFASSHDELPSVVTGTLSALDPSRPMQCVLVNRDRSLISDERLKWWAAASGVAMADGVLPADAAVPLVAPPRARVSVRATRLDRALKFAAVVSAACVALAGIQYGNVPAPSIPPFPAQDRSGQATAGALLDRIGTIAPGLIAQTQSATYASGAWVLTLPDAVDDAALKRAVSAMQANGLVVQSTVMPIPRIRVQLP